MLQVGWALLAGLLLFVVVRQVIARDRVAGMIVAAGLLLRAIAGQALFWISYLHLPIAAQLQSGNGFWFFGGDGKLYLANAIELSDHGVAAIVSASRGGPSVSYVQTLSTFVLILGQSAAVGLLLNLFSYVLTCGVIIWWGRQSPATRRPALFALIALTASPAAVLWSVQPLKDTFFQFLVVAFIGGTVVWNMAWCDEGRRLRLLAVSLLAMNAALYLVAGVRWYFAFALLMSSAIFFVHLSISGTSRRGLSLAASGVAVFLLSRAFLAGAGPFVPAELRSVLAPFEQVTGEVPGDRLPTPSWALSAMRMWRDRFVKSGGTTALAPPSSPQIPSQPQELPAQPVGGLPPPASPVAAAPIDEWLLGSSATFVPSSLHRALGLPGIGGGRGMLWLTDIDTLFFDAVIVVGLVWSLLASGRSFWSNSVLVLVVMVTLAIAAPLVYTVTNFGTLFRLRGMVLVTAALLPLAGALWLKRPVFGTDTEAVHAAPAGAMLAAPGESPERI